MTFRRTRRHQGFAIRALWFALLMFAVLVQPVLVAAGEVHESAHLLQSDHGHAGDHHAPGIDPDDSDPGDGSDRWHVLMHSCHCCGQPVAIASSDSVNSSAPLLSPPPGTTWPGHLNAQPTRLLRPPIIG